MFQFKINHNILYTKDKLKKANLVSDDSCYLCKNERHTIVHMFVKCPLVVSFWKNFHLWWLQNTMENIHLSEVTYASAQVPTSAKRSTADSKIFYLQM